VQTTPPDRATTGFLALMWFCNLCKVLQKFAKVEPRRPMVKCITIRFYWRFLFSVTFYRRRIRAKKIDRDNVNPCQARDVGRLTVKMFLQFIAQVEGAILMPGADVGQKRGKVTERRRGMPWRFRHDFVSRALRLCRSV
jgi:hypothetical protein